MNRTYLSIPHGREAALAGWDARREKQNVVVPSERRATTQTARQGASQKGFDALARATLLRALRMRYGHSTRRASRIRANASETRLMGNAEIGSHFDNILPACGLTRQAA
jgi:hypothetical protein